MLRIIKKVVGEEPKVMEINSDLGTLRNHVGGGFIEVVRLGAGICLVIDEEGKLNGSEPNFDLGRDVIMGDCFFVSEGYVNGEIEFISLTSLQIAMILEGDEIDFTSEPKNEPDLTFEIMPW